MSESNQTIPGEPATRDQLHNLSDVLVALDHRLIDLRHALENAYESENLMVVHGQFMATRAMVNEACAAFLAINTDRKRNHG